MTAWSDAFPWVSFQQMLFLGSGPNASSTTFAVGTWEQPLGVLQPILVREHPDKPGDYEIIAGERRWRAAQLAQLHEVPVVIKVLSNQETLEVALVENLQREDLSPLEEAIGLQRLIAQG